MGNAGPYWLPGSRIRENTIISLYVSRLRTHDWPGFLPGVELEPYRSPVRAPLFLHQESVQMLIFQVSKVDFSLSCFDCCALLARKS